MVVLIGEDGMTYAEVGSHVDISERTVESYVNRILQRYPSSKRPRDAITEMYYEVVRDFPSRDNTD